MTWDLAGPKADGSDTARLLELATAQGYLGRAALQGTGPRWVAGMELVDSCGGPTERVDGMRSALGHPKLDAVAALLDRWPAARDAFGLLDFFSPVLVGWPESGQGCISGHRKFQEHGGRLGVEVTVDRVTGCAEGLVHELVHQRLHLLGLDLETHDRVLLLNRDDEFYFSPIRRDVMRPMSAVIHGVLAWLWMLEVDAVADDGGGYAQYNVPKVRRGLREIAEHARWTPAGQEFAAGMLEWGARAVAAGERQLKALDLPEVLPETGWLP